MRILGFDTETFEGQVKVLACSDGSFIESSDTDSLLDFIYERGKEADLSVLWNIGFDVGCIVRGWIVEHEGKLRSSHYRKIALTRRLGELDDKALLTDRRLSTGERSERKALKFELDHLSTVERFTTRRYSLWYIADKGLRIIPRGKAAKGKRKAKRGVYLFDASQFYATGFGGQRLETAAQTTFGEGKSDGEEGIDRARLGSEPGYYEAHRDAIIRYCIRDCQLTARLMARAIEGFQNLGLPFPERPWSKASVSREHLKALGVLEKSQMAYREELDLTSYRGYWRAAYRGGIFVSRALGKWGPGRAYDINSAYPAAMVDFPSLEGARLVRYGEPDFDRAFFRFYRVKARPCPQLPTRDPESTRLMYWADGKERTWILAEPDLRALDLYHRPYEIVDGIGIVTPSGERPLAYLADLFGRKAEIKERYGADSVEYFSLKIVLNGTYGLFAQRRPTEGPLTNLVYASYITARCRLQLWEMSKQIEDRGGTVLSWATDGLLAVPSDRALPLVDSTALGAWSSHPFESYIGLESGIYVLDGTLKRRGAPTLTVDMLKECPTKALEVTKSSPIKLKAAIIQRRSAEIGAFRPHTLTICPAKAAFDAGFKVPKEVLCASISTYFDTGWLLDWGTEGQDRL